MEEVTVLLKDVVKVFSFMLKDVVDVGVVVVVLVDIDVVGGLLVDED